MMLPFQVPAKDRLGVALGLGASGFGLNLGVISLFGFGVELSSEIGAGKR
jgi:hypothetical protein